MESHETESTLSKQTTASQISNADQADKAVHLIFANKINAKNAFDVDTEFVESIGQLLKKSK